MVESANPKETGAAEEKEKDSQTSKAQAALVKFLNDYQPDTHDGEPDLLHKRFRIDMASPLSQFDTETSRAYDASDVMEPSRQLFAQICDTGRIQRSRIIQVLKTIEHPSLLRLADAGAVELSALGERRFVIIYDRPAGRKLSELLAEKKIPMQPHYIIEHIIAPLAAAINALDEAGIGHGLVNPDNIYFEGKAMLGPCVAEPCGYSQPRLYESIERMQADPAGKGEGSAAMDYYALAVTVVYLWFGKDYMEALAKRDIPREVLHEGAYNVITQQRELPEAFSDFLRGLLTQLPEERWNYRYLKPWLDGKHYHVLPPPPPVEAVRPFEHGNISANTRRELAHIFAGDWEQMINALQNNQLAHWISVSLRNKPLSEIITKLSRTVAELQGKNEVQVAEQLMHITLLLDSRGPLRLKNLSMHVDGIDTLIADLHHKKAHQELQLLAKFVEQNMLTYWSNTREKKEEEKIPPSLHAIIMRIDRLRTCIRNSGYGFGLERMLYDLNPEMPCLSPMLEKWHVTTLKDLLHYLDKLAPGLQKEEPIDRHIAAFIAAKIGIQHEIKLNELAPMPGLAKNRSMIALYLLSMAQHRVGATYLPGITHWIALHILPLLDNIHSKTLRKKLKLMVAELADSGSAQQLSTLMIGTDFAAADKNGFQHAVARYQQDSMQIERYEKGDMIGQESARVGFIFAKALAYAALLFGFINAMHNG